MSANRRIDALRRRLADNEIESLCVSNVLNVVYLTGMEGVFDDNANAAAVVTADQALLYTDARYGEAAVAAADGSAWEIRVPAENLYQTLCADLTSAGIGVLGIESSVPYGRFRYVSEQFEGSVIALDHWIEELRQVKDAEELRRIALAADLADRAFDHALGLIAPGMTESALALEIEYFMRRNGAGGVAFAPIVASGPNSARPHAIAGGRVLEPGDLVVIDLGARVEGYCSDMTRTIALGRADERQRAIYEAVLEAHDTALEAVRAGIAGRDLDKVARDVLEARELSEYFGHGLGHGVGMAVHELPSVSSRGRDALRAGAVITVEPGVYIPGFGGVRIEDLVVVEDGGHRRLTGSRTDLIEVG